MDSFVRRTNDPSCAPESLLLKKKRRYVEWNSKPSTIANDLSKFRILLNKARDEYNCLERDEERWVECIEIARRKITTSFEACQQNNIRLTTEASELRKKVDKSNASMVQNFLPFA